MVVCLEEIKFYANYVKFFPSHLYFLHLTLC